MKFQKFILKLQNYFKIIEFWYNMIKNRGFNMVMLQNTFFYKSGEYISKESDNIYVVGISEKLANDIGLITNVEFYDADSYYFKNEVFATVESGCIAAEIHLPTYGIITEVNSELRDNPSLINADPYGQGWLIKVKVFEQKIDLTDLSPVNDFFDENQ